MLRKPAQDRTNPGDFRGNYCQLLQGVISASTWSDQITSTARAHQQAECDGGWISHCSADLLYGMQGANMIASYNNDRCDIPFGAILRPSGCDGFGNAVACANDSEFIRLVSMAMYTC